MKYCSCPKCGKEFELTPDYDGASFRCDFCNEIIFVPENFSNFPTPKEMNSTEKDRIIYVTVPEKNNTVQVFGAAIVSTLIFFPLGIIAVILAVCGKIMGKKGKENLARGFYHVSMYFSVPVVFLFVCIVLFFVLSLILGR